MTDVTVITGSTHVNTDCCSAGPSGLQTCISPWWSCWDLVVLVSGAACKPG